MEMIPVQSSNIQAIGFEGGKLCVRFHDGKEYEFPDVTEQQHTELMNAPSKGRALNGLISMRAGVVLKTPKKADVAKGGPIHVSQAEGCCAKHLNNASLSGKLDNLEMLECPKCGTAYHAKIYGSLVNWETVCDVLLMRLK